MIKRSFAALHMWTPSLLPPVYATLLNVRSKVIDYRSATLDGPALVNSGQNWPNHRHRPKCGRLLGRVRPGVARFLDELDLNPAVIGPRATIDRIRPQLWGQCGPTLVDSGPTLAGLGPEFVEIGPQLANLSPNFGRNRRPSSGWADLGPDSAKFQRLRQMPAQFRKASACIRRACMGISFRND